jgi:hypothetical protein
MMSILKIQSIRGDDELQWDPAFDDERVLRARCEFQRARDRQFFAYTRTENGDTEVIEDFDPNAREILMAIPLLGG